MMCTDKKGQVLSLVSSHYHTLPHTNRSRLSLQQVFSDTVTEPKARGSTSLQEGEGCTYMSDDEPIREGTDVELREQGSLGRPDLLARLHELHRGHDFDRTLVNLGRDVQHLSEAQ